LLALSLACLGCAAMPSAHAAPANTWDGTWTGKLNDQAPMSVVVADGKAVSYEIMGTPIGHRVFQGCRQFAAVRRSRPLIATS